LRSAESLRRAIGEARRRYTRSINFREGWRGHLWQGRFASFVRDEDHLLTAARYVELNPVRAGLVQAPSRYRWSSAAAHLRGRDDERDKGTSLNSDSFYLPEDEKDSDFAEYELLLERFETERAHVANLHFAPDARMTPDARCGDQDESLPCLLSIFTWRSAREVTMVNTRQRLSGLISDDPDKVELIRTHIALSPDYIDTHHCYHLNMEELH
jgi:hypothetical protein